MSVKRAAKESLMRLLKLKAVVSQSGDRSGGPYAHSTKHWFRPKRATRSPCGGPVPRPRTRSPWSAFRAARQVRWWMSRCEQPLKISGGMRPATGNVRNRAQGGCSTTASSKSLHPQAARNSRKVAQRGG
uniref:Uncharacterized protein n=1 Tax=Trypanosoma congolense (strain IL3000) TaxID=1068625 RepID=F9WE26_TRYCI|nr:hypothetical protein, unlikely [Trypanosoma congolense IL3000]